MPARSKGTGTVLRITKIIPGNPGQMSDPSAIILGMNEKWIKYSYVCPSCDSLIEYTCRLPYDFPSGDVRKITCVCGGNAVQVSVADATITPTTNEKENMTTSSFTTDEQVNALQERINNLELMIESYQRQLTSSSANYNELRSQINRIIDNMTYDYWYNPNTESETILSDICEIINYEPKREVSFTAVMHFNGRIDVPLSDWDGFDLHEVLSEAYVDINHGDVVIDDYELYEADEA